MRNKIIRDIEQIGTKGFILLRRPKKLRQFLRNHLGKDVGFRAASSEDAYELSKLYGFSIYGCEEYTHKRSCISSEFEYINNSENLGEAIIATINGKIVGSIILARFPDEQDFFPDFWLYGVIVKKFYRGAGIGEGLVTRAIERASELGARNLNLIVSVENPAALGLYLKMGFEQVDMPELDPLLSALVKHDGRRRAILSRRV